MLFVNACCECVFLCVCACVCACACVHASVYLKRVVVITVSIKLKSYWKLFFLCWSYEQLLGWGDKHGVDKKQVKVRFILKGHLSGQLLLSWPTP